MLALKQLFLGWVDVNQLELHTMALVIKQACKHTFHTRKNAICTADLCKPTS
jgi:hypothetical protein